MISDQYLENLAGILTAYAILAILVERALYQIFHSKAFTKLEELLDRQTSDAFDLKPWLSMALCIKIATTIELDMVAELFRREPAQITTWVTGLFIAGGSSGVYAFWKNARTLRNHADPK